MLFQGRVRILLAVAVMILPGACDKAQEDRDEAAETPPAPGHVAPPAPTGLVRQAGRALLTGEAAPSAQVRLATPEGQAWTAVADRQGSWVIALPQASEPRIFGLSMTVAGRQVQSQGYVLVGPDGRAALLRAGAGALRLDKAAGSGVRAIDFDREGGAVVSGQASPGASIYVRLDGRQGGEARADADGRYAVVLASRLSPGRHRVRVSGDGVDAELAFDATPAAPLAPGPWRSQLTSNGLRADWLTPGGGIQSTLVIG